MSDTLGGFFIDIGRRCRVDFRSISDRPLKSGDGLLGFRQGHSCCFPLTCLRWLAQSLGSQFADLFSTKNRRRQSRGCNLKQIVN